MKHVLTMSALSLLAVKAFCAEAQPGEVLAKVSQRYKSMQTYLIEADTRMTVSRAGQVGMLDTRTLLAVGKEGAFRVERNENGTPEIRVSDGKVTWKALPAQKVWSKQELAQEADSEDSDDGPSRFEAQDLFAQAQRSFVTRYTALEKYASAATIDKSDRVKFNGGKVDCFVVRIVIPGVIERLYVAKDSFLVLRNIENSTGKTGPPSEIITEYRRIVDGVPAADLFEFQPGNGSKEVAGLTLPGEREVSLVGERAVDFTLNSLTGEPVHLADLRGKVVMLDFWATWCQPCRQELPTIEALSRKYRDRNVVVLGINNEEVSTAKRFLDKYHPDLQTLHDAGRKVNRIYGCSAIPTVFVINPQGTIVAHFVGGRTQDVLVAALKQAGMQ